MEGKFSGKPSIKLSHRPFYSIVIPCYNPNKYLSNLLQSIVDQNMNDDIEVILSDDHSPNNYDDIVSKFDQILSIKRIQTDYNFAPGNTREKGTTVAEGEWLGFADQDDVYIPNTLKDIKETILKNDEKYYVVCGFIEANPETNEIIHQYYRPLGWNHGKFYNLDHAWKAYDIHFKKDLESHEDVYISSIMNCLMSHLNRDPLFIDIYPYIWYCRKESLSHEKFIDGKTTYYFLENYLPDYIRSTGDVYLEQYQRGAISEAYGFESFCEIVSYCYFYMQGFIYNDPVNYISDNFEWVRGYFIRGKKIFNCKNEDIWNFMARHSAEKYMEVEETAHIGVGPYIPYFTFMEWMNILHQDDEEWPTEGVKYTNENLENNFGKRGENNVKYN